MPKTMRGMKKSFADERNYLFCIIFFISPSNLSISASFSITGLIIVRVCRGIPTLNQLYFVLRMNNFSL